MDDIKGLLEPKNETLFTWHAFYDRISDTDASISGPQWTFILQSKASIDTRELCANWDAPSRKECTKCLHFFNWEKKRRFVSKRQTQACRCRCHCSDSQQSILMCVLHSEITFWCDVFSGNDDYCKSLNWDFSLSSVVINNFTATCTVVVSEPTVKCMCVQCRWSLLSKKINIIKLNRQVKPCSGLFLYFCKTTHSLVELSRIIMSHCSKWKCMSHEMCRSLAGSCFSQSTFWVNLAVN